MENKSNTTTLERNDMVPFLYAYVALFGFSSFVGIFGNISIIVITMLNKVLRCSRNAFIISLAVADLMVSCITMPASIVGVLLGKQWFEERATLCSFISTMCAPGCVASMHSIAWIAVSRYYYIGEYSTYLQYFTPSKIAVYISSIWLLSFTVHLPNHIGWGKTGYSTMLRFCTLDTELYSYTLFYASVLVVAIVMAFVFYLKIYLVLKASKLPKSLIVARRHRAVVTQHKGQSGLIEEVKIIKTSFKIFVLFLCTWMPLCILLLISFKVTTTWWVYLMFGLLAHCNSTLNFVVYFTGNEVFRHAALDIWNKCTKKPSNVIAAINDNKNISLSQIPHHSNEQV